MTVIWCYFGLGIFYDRTKKCLHLLVPFLGITIDFGEEAFWGTTHYRGADSLDPICGVITVDDTHKVTCRDCLAILEGNPRGIERFRS